MTTSATGPILAHSSTLMLRAHDIMAKIIPISLSPPRDRRADESPFIATFPSRFVGRERELEELRQALSDAATGRGRLVLLAGEAGIGKTRLAEEFTLIALQRKAEVVWGRCWEGEGAPAFWPWLQMLRTLVHARDTHLLRKELGAGAADIAHVVSELRAQFPEIQPPAVLDLQHARFRFFDSVTVFLRNAARAHPLVLILDDLHWADTPSLLLLRFLARELAGTHMCLIGTYRDGEVDRAHPLADTLGKLTREGTILTLGGLARSEVSRLIENTLGTTTTANVADAVYQRTEGNPFFVTEIVRLLPGDGESAAALTPLSSSIDMAIPQRVRQTIRQRLERISPVCQHVLATAAVMGQEFNLKIIERVEAGLQSTSTKATRLASLDEALDAHLITCLPGNLGTYRFSHALIRETLYEDLPLGTRLELHRQIGVVLEALDRTDHEHHLAELVYHFEQAASGGEATKALTYAVRAGEYATSRLAYEDAVDHYERALRMLDLLEPDEKQRGKLLLRLGDACWWAGKDAQSRETYEQAFHLAQRIGDAELLAQAALSFGRVREETGVLDSVLVGFLRVALQALGDQPRVLRAQVLARLSVALYFSPAVDERERLSAEALAIARQHGDRRTLAMALIARHFALWGPDYTEERLRLATEAIRLAEDLNDRDLVREGQAWKIFDLFEIGDSIALSHEVLSYAQRGSDIRIPRYRWHLLLISATRALLAGRFDEGERLAQEAVACRDENEVNNAMQFFGVQMFWLRRQQGRGAELEPAVAALAAQFPTLPAWRCALALLYSDRGDYEKARHEFLSLAARDFTDFPRDANWLPGLTALAEVCTFLGDRHRASQLYTLLLPYATHNIVVATSAACYGSVARYLGLLATTLTRWDEAEAHFASALHFNRQLGSRPFVAHTECDYASMRLARNQPGDHEQAHALLQSALTTTQELGMTRLSEKIESQISSLAFQDVEAHNHRPSSPRKPSDINPLTTVDSKPCISNFPAPNPQALTPTLFRREGEYWTIAYQGSTCRLKQMRGLVYLAHLLRYPHHEFHCFEFIALTTKEGQAGVTSDTVDSCA